MKHLLTLTFLSIFGLTHAQVPSYVPTNGLVGWWPFNGNANDESGNGNNGTVNGATLTADRNGVTNRAYSFDGVNDKIVVAAQTSIPQQSDYTVSLWFNSPVSTYNGAFISCSTWFCKLGHDNPGFFYKDEIGNINNTWYEQAHFGVEPTVNTWNNLILKKTNNTVTLILNNSVIGSMTTYGFSNFSPTSLIQFGYYCCQEYYSGSLDDIGIWNRALTECEIQDLYHAQVGFTTVDAGQDQSICRGAEVTLNGTGGNFLSWNNGVFNGVPFAPNQTSNYVLTGSDSLGCVGSDTVLVTVLDNASSTINQTAIDSYTLNGQTYTQSGTYTQVLTAANGCDSTITLNLELDFTGIQTNTLTSLKLYPNPVQDVLHIEGLTSKEFEYEVLSIDGKLLQKGKSQGEIAVKELRKGNYVLRVGLQQVSFVKQ